jgi:hypothetical protein
MQLRGESQLPHPIFTVGRAGGFSGRLNRWQQQSNHQTNDRDHDQQFDQRKTFRQRVFLREHAATNNKRGFWLKQPTAEILLGDNAPYQSERGTTGVSPPVSGNTA